MFMGSSQKVLDLIVKRAAYLVAGAWFGMALLLD